MSLPDSGKVEDYTEAQFKELLQQFEADKEQLSKKQKAAVARYNFKKEKNQPVLFADSEGAKPAPATAGEQATKSGGEDDIISQLPADVQELAKKDPASLTKDEKIKLAKAKSQLVRARAAAKKAAADGGDEKKGPSPEDVANEKALGFATAKELQERFGSVLAKWQMQTDKPYCVVKEAPRTLDVIRYLQMEMGFEQIRDLTASDYPDRKVMEVVYNFYRHRDKAHMAVKVPVARPETHDAELPVVPSITGIYPGADWLEREVFDLFGIVFEGHPYLRRIMMPDDWVGYPLRKDYDLTKEQFIGLGQDGRDIVSFRSEDGW